MKKETNQFCILGGRTFGPVREVPPSGPWIPPGFLASEAPDRENVAAVGAFQQVLLECRRLDKECGSRARALQCGSEQEVQ